MKKENLMALISLLIIIAIALFVVNLDLIFPTYDYDTQGITAAASSFAVDYNPEANAAVLIEEFSDFQCPYCARAGMTVEKIIAAYGNKVNVVFKHMPANSGSKKAAEASECARDQGKFWEYHHALFSSQYSLSANNLKKYAEQLGLDTEQFNKCLDSGEKTQIINQDLQETFKRGVQGTPTFFIKSQKLVGAQPFEAFKALIDIELGKYVYNNNTYK